MGDDFQSGAFWIAIASICAGSFLAMMAHCFRLKCTTINLCGMKFVRDIALENESYELELQHPVTPRPSDTIPLPTLSPPSRRGSSNV
jgi:hypothetical protein